MNFPSLVGSPWRMLVSWVCSFCISYNVQNGQIKIDKRLIALVQYSTSFPPVFQNG